jgi:hypothetical protein
MPAFVAAMLVGSSVALAREGAEHRPRQSTVRYARELLIAWFAVALALSYAEFFRGAADRPPTIEFGIFVPVAIGLVLLWRSDRRKGVDAKGEADDRQTERNQTGARAAQSCRNMRQLPAPGIQRHDDHPSAPADLNGNHE